MVNKDLPPDITKAKSDPPATFAEGASSEEVIDDVQEDAVIFPERTFEASYLFKEAARRMVAETTPEEVAALRQKHGLGLARTLEEVRQDFEDVEAIIRESQARKDERRAEFTVVDGEL